MKSENIGALLAAACAVHCIAVPLLASSAALAQVSPLHHPLLEVGLLGGTVLIGYGTLGPSFRTHRRPAPLVLLTLGIGLMLLAHAVGEAHGFGSGITLTGAAFVMAAQWVNRRLRGSVCHVGCCSTTDSSGEVSTVRVPTP